MNRGLTVYALEMRSQRPFRVWYPEELKAFTGEITEHRMYVYIPLQFLSDQPRGIVVRVSAY